MEQYILKSAVVAEIENRIKKYILLQQKSEMSDLQEELQNKIDCLNSIKGYIINTLEVKEVDLKDEVERFAKECGYKSAATIDFQFARHFFALGLSASNPITAADSGMAEEIIINLKRVEQDYRINLTKEIEWLRNQVKKGE